MLTLTVSEAAAAMQAFGDVLPGQDVSLKGVSTDSRTVFEGQLFVCLTGESFDGHAFAEQAVDSGAAAIVSDRPMPDLEARVPILLVRDTLEALGLLAGAWRLRSEATVVAVTGSAGKTTVKEMLAAILSRVGSTACNFKNFNNLIGVPNTILGLTGKERFWVLELGISLPGEMDGLGSTVMPDVAVINNIGPAHLEGLGGMDGVAEAKTSLLRYMRPGGKAFASVDYPLLWEEARKIVPTVVGFSAEGNSAQVKAEYLGPAEGGGHFRLDVYGETLEFEAPFVGDYFAENIAAAAAAAVSVGASLDDVAAGISAAGVPEHRFQIRQAGEWTVVDDSYNANPLSMRRAIENCAHMAGERNLILVLGEMRELGKDAVDLHYELGRFIAGTGARAVFWHCGESDAVEAGLSGGGYEGEFIPVGNPEMMLANLAEMNISGGVALCKGSRSCLMERFAAALQDAFDGEGA